MTIKIPIEDEPLHNDFILHCRANGGQKWFAKQHGFSTAYICDVYNKRRYMTEKLANILGYKLERKWVKQ